MPGPELGRPPLSSSPLVLPRRKLVVDDYNNEQQPGSLVELVESSFVVKCGGCLSCK